MNDIFKKQYVEKIADVLKRLESLYGSSCIWITNLETNHSWCSDRMIDIFNFDSQDITEIEKVLLKYVHLFDKAEFIENIYKRFKGIDLDQELLIHFLHKNGKYYMYRLLTDIAYSDEGKPQYLIVVMKNQNIISEIDPVTDLYSQSKFIENLEDTISKCSKFAVLKIHIDGFSTFNLVYGKDYVDELLKSISINFIYLMTYDSSVYHLDGENFAFIYRNADKEALIKLEQKIRSILKKGIICQDKNNPLRIASGAMVVNDYYEGDASSLYGQVDYALEQSISKNKEQLVLFNDVVQTKHGTDYALMKVIHESVSNACDGFYLEYQPIVESHNGKIVGVESLLRWRKEPYGNIPPGAFIGWMETDPSMYELGMFVLRKALEDVAGILAEHEDFFVNVNISVRQIERKEFREELERILEETGFPANHLCLELTERCKDFPIDRLYDEVEFLHSKGIRVAVDDYGTGSASSNIVMNVPMDEIKIDLSFVKGIEENFKKQAMVRSIVEFANECGMNTCIEGVEDESLEKYLRRYKARWFQGYYYSKPVPIERVKQLLFESGRRTN